jgi:hypothetical protein
VSKACQRCPCPDLCLGWPAFCAWAAEDPQDEVKVRHIYTRSAAQKTEGHRLQSSRFEGPQPLEETLTLVRAMRACPFRSIDTGCGCAGGRCSLRHGAVVSHRDCMDCLRRYPANLDPVEKNDI